MEKILTELKIKFPDLSRPFKVMIAGTFDILHPGHLSLIKTASKIGEVYVIIARDSSVEKFKGQKPIMSEEQRMEIIKNIKGVKCTELGSDSEDWMKRIIEINPDLFLLGPNQWGNEEFYENEMKESGLKTIFRRMSEMDTRFSLNSSTKIKERILKVYKSTKKRKK